MTGTGAYGLLPLTITNNYDERNFIVSWMVLGQGFGALPVVFLGTVLVAGIVFVVCGVIINLLGPDFFIGNMGVFYLLTVFQTSGYTMTMFAGSQLPVELVEIAKYRLGKDMGGIISASYNFMTKLVGSLVSSVTLLILGFYGFVSVEASSFDQLAELNAQGIGLQTDRALEGLWNVSYLFPIIGFALAAVAFFFVRVSRKKVRIYMKVNSGEITREEGEKLLAELK